MAKLVYSALVNDVRGKTGATVFSHNRRGPFARKTTVPRNPRSTLQNTWRGSVRLFSQQWAEALTETQRERWRQFATNQVTTDPFGQSHTLTGFQAFLRSNLWARFSVSSSQPYPPTTIEIPTILSFTAQGFVGSSNLRLTWQTSPMTSSQRLLIFATNPLPGGRNTPTGGWAKVYTEVATQGQPTNRWSFYLQNHYPPQPGQKTFLRVAALTLFTYIPCAYTHAQLIWKP